MTQSHETPQHVPQNYERLADFFKHLSPREQRQLVTDTAPIALKTQFEMNGQPDDCKAFLDLQALPFFELLLPYQLLQGDAAQNPLQAINELPDYQILQGAK